MTWKRTGQAVIMVVIVNALFTYGYWTLTNRVTALEQTNQKILILIEETMKEVSRDGI